MATERRIKTGLVLTGGSLRGICAETALLMALDDINYPIDAIIGTSAGAVVGSMYACGMGGHEILDRITSMTKKDYMDKDILGTIWGILKLGKGWHGLMKGKRFLKWLQNNLPTRRIEDTQIPFHVVVTNISRGSPQVKSKGLLAEFVRASAGIPIAFRAINIEGEYYVDGGAVNNIALDEMYDLHPEMDRYIVGTALRVHKDEKEPNNDFMKKFFTPIFLVDRAIDAIGNELREENIEVPANKQVVIIRPETPSIHLDEIHLANLVTKAAYENTKEVLSTLNLAV